MGNQQFTVRNVTFDSAVGAAVQLNWCVYFLSTKSAPTDETFKELGVHFLACVLVGQCE
jgi:hypothetical protein